MTEFEPSASQLTDAPAKERTLRKTLSVAAAVVVALVAGGSLRLLANERQAHDLQEQTLASLQRTVATIHAKAANPTRTVSLPATLRGNEESVIYARTGGYVSAWHKTIGDTVRKGELLAQLSAPEQEQALLQAKAVRQQRKSRATLTRDSLARWEVQFQSNIVSRHAFEEKRSEYQQAEADLAAAGAEVQRLEQLLALQRIVAPFDGVIVRRSVDVGALVTAGGTELFALAQTRPLRLTVWVPQVYANDVRSRQEVEIALEEFPGQRFAGSIERVSGGLDATTRARQVEITVPNGDGALLPGAYASVILDLKNSVNALVIPPNALVVDQKGTQVVLVGGDNRLEFRHIKLGRDLGTELEVLEGIAREDAIVANPSDQLRAGEVVRVQSATRMADQAG